MKKHLTISLILLALLLAVGFTILTHNFPFPGKTSDDFSLITGSSQTYTPRRDTGCGRRSPALLQRLFRGHHDKAAIC